MARRPRREEVKRRTEGLTLFLADLQNPAVTITPIPKAGRNAVVSCEVVYDDLVVPVEDRIGEEGLGFTYILDGLNPERLMVASEALGCGKAALDKAVTYAKEREVFGRPIGKNQGLAFPLAEAYNRLKAAELVLRQAAWQYDSGYPASMVGEGANIAKWLCADAGFQAADQAMQTLGGIDYARSTTWSALLEGGAPHADRADQPGDDPQLRQRARARPAPVVLIGRRQWLGSRAGAAVTVAAVLLAAGAAGASVATPTSCWPSSTARPVLTALDAVLRPGSTR
ncbi:MAG: acyl-CoA dehydrogenase [Acidimicrobiales bacterium]